jgi:hypothetical protein
MECSVNNSTVVNSSESIIQSSPKTVNRVWGAILSLFGLALKVEQADGRTGYVTISELKEKFVFSHLRGINKAEIKSARNDKIITDLFLSTINPIKGTVVSKATLDKFSQKVFEYGLNYSSSEPKELYSSIRKIRASIYTQNGMTDDQKKFIGDIKLGDILFHRTDDTVASDIVKAQTFTSAIGIGPNHRDSRHHNHVYMCAKIDEHGKKWFAEAAWPSGRQDEIRLISEDDVRCFIKQDHGAISEVFRCTNSELATKAAEEACRITTQLDPQAIVSTEEDPTQLRYSIRGGYRSLIIPNSFGHGPKMRLFQWILSTRNGGMPATDGKTNSFFCSFLVGYAYQMAEARPIVAKLVRENPESRSTSVNSGTPHKLASRHAEDLDKQMQVKIDPLYTSPADFHAWICGQKNLFTSIESYQQPNIQH